LLPNHVVRSELLDPLPVHEADRRDFETILKTTARQVVCSHARRDASGRINGLSPLFPISRVPIYRQRARKRAKAMRPCRAGDIALLAPTGTNLWIYEREIERRAIPIASQAGKSFFRRQEVQDLIAVARAIADRRDTLGFGALLRGPLVGLTEEEIADAIVALPVAPGGAPPRLHLWTDRDAVSHPVLNRTLEVLQNLARRARRTTPFQLMAEAVEELNVRPILRARYRLSTECALASASAHFDDPASYHRPDGARHQPDQDIFGSPNACYQPQPPRCT
jgi:superfamily I DNA/RNA helicase